MPEDWVRIQKNKKSLPIPVIPILDTDEEDVHLINSLGIKLLQEQPTIQTNSSKDEATPPSDKDKDDSVIPIHDRNQERKKILKCLKTLILFGRMGRD